MQLHELGTTQQRRKKRIGRGGKRGTYSGRGIKGQKSRAGRRIRPAVRDTIMRIPKRRGFFNKPISVKPFAVNLKDLSARLQKEKRTGAVVDIKLLKDLRFLPSRFRGTVKILGDGDLAVALMVKDISVSKSARAKIEKAGGTVE